VDIGVQIVTTGGTHLRDNPLGADAERFGETVANLLIAEIA
jgi:hypothetical protein